MLGGLRLASAAAFVQHLTAISRRVLLQTPRVANALITPIFLRHALNPQLDL